MRTGWPLPGAMTPRTSLVMSRTLAPLDSGATTLRGRDARIIESPDQDIHRSGDAFRQDCIVPDYWWVAGLALIAVAGSVASVLIALRHVRDDRGTPARDECRAQAERVSVWPGPSADPQPVALLNRSDEPVYEAVATFVFIDGSGPTRGEEVSPELAARRISLGVLPPGRWRVCVDGGWNGMYSRLGVEVAFTDGGGAHWVRRADGRLEQLPRRAFEYFNLSRPLALASPEPEKASEPRPGHRARVSSFSLGDGLGRRWSARCSCGWIVTTGSHADSVRRVRPPPPGDTRTDGLARGHLSRPRRRLSAVTGRAPAG